MATQRSSLDSSIATLNCRNIPSSPVVKASSSWLRQHIFPVEREFTDPKARDEAPQFFRELARNGTTTVMAYAAIYEELHPP
jgi:cytosine/adenosine deaminase-related metal-dependent hydrolase